MIFRTEIFPTGLKEEKMKKIFCAILVLCLAFSTFAVCESAVFGSGKVYVREKGGTLHLRSAATTESESLGIVHHGDEIDVLMLGDEWSYIFSFREGKEGYIKTKYIVDFVPSENMFTEVTIEEVTDSCDTYPMPGKYHLDLDGDGTIDTVNSRLFYDEYGMECFTITFETAYGASGEATIPYASYDARIAFAKLDESERVYIFVTGDVASTDFETYGFYAEEGHMKNLDFYPPVPFIGGLGMAGMLKNIVGGKIVIIPTLDVAGTRFYETNMIMDNGVIVPEENGKYYSVYDLTDLETWEYASLKTITDVPCFLEGNAAILESGARVVVEWLNVSEKQIGFITEDGKNGYFEYSEALDHDWGIYVGGIYESDAFEEIRYAG